MQPPSIGSSLVAMSASQALGIERRFVVLSLYKTGAGWVLKGKGPTVCLFDDHDQQSERREIQYIATIPEEVTGIDEAQPFEDLQYFCIKAADHDGQIVIVVCLDGHYLR
ncbi:putative thymidine kinase [Helianthus annuus]|uniref:thymidine kinase n=1 Tax=Helianthus annuus TaxID=4232 RepID=A0A9K3II07_HELAN|nr:putative thymidine kinase [Helianthus annuus]